MSHQDIVNAVNALAPGSQWSLSGDDLSGLFWLDSVVQRPTDVAITSAIARYVKPMTIDQRIRNLESKVGIVSV